MIGQQHLLKFKKYFLASIPIIGIIVLVTFLHHPLNEFLQSQPPSILRPASPVFWQKSTSYHSNPVKNLKLAKSFSSYILTFVVLYLHPSTDLSTSLLLPTIILTIHGSTAFLIRNPLP